MVGNQRHTIRGYNQTFERLKAIIKFLKVQSMAPWPCGSKQMNVCNTFQPSASYNHATQIHSATISLLLLR
jgi:hypothetical protein